MRQSNPPPGKPGPSQCCCTDSNDVALLPPISLTEAACPTLGVRSVSEDGNEGASDVGSPIKVSRGVEV